jgi:hypothetical protein
VTAARTTRLVSVRWDVLPNEHGSDMLWLGSWLVGDARGGWLVHSGRGGDSSEIAPPEEASGIRGAGSSDGLTPEYIDIGLEFDRVATAELDWSSAAAQPS